MGSLVGALGSLEEPMAYHLEVFGLTLEALGVTCGCQNPPQRDPMLQRGCITLHRGYNRLHRGSIMLHRGCIMLQRGCIIPRRGCILLHRGCSMLHRGCIMLHRGCTWRICSICSICCIWPAWLGGPRLRQPAQVRVTVWFLGLLTAFNRLPSAYKDT